ncbi:hypothetical protein [Sulfurivirga sp.]|uniref:hypothetical protein n=1 Tax=Sulfurivirga sp. TaxID=2614236 RepID=UPI0025F9472A|nr:hypothetical protein [Sulfurivirga sp.]
MKPNMRLSALAGALLLAGVAQAADTSVRVSTGYFYVDGQSNDLNSPDTTIQSVPLSIKLKSGRFGVRLSSSWLEVKPRGQKAESGQGDTTLSLSYDLTEQPWWTITVKEKFATGSKSKGLSSGYNDTRLQLDYFRTVGSGKSVFATAGYVIKGGKSDNPDYQDAFYASVGAGTVLAQNWNGGVSLDYNQATNKQLDDAFGGSLFLGYRMTRQAGVNLFVSTDNTSTTSAGVSLSYKFQ